MFFYLHKRTQFWDFFFLFASFANMCTCIDRTTEKRKELSQFDPASVSILAFGDISYNCVQSLWAVFSYF